MPPRPSDSSELTAADLRALKRIRDHYLAMAAAVDLILNLEKIQEIGDSFAALVRAAQGIPEADGGSIEERPRVGAEGNEPRPRRRRQDVPIDEEPRLMGLVSVETRIAGEDRVLAIDAPMTFADPGVYADVGALLREALGGGFMSSNGASLLFRIRWVPSPPMDDE